MAYSSTYYTEMLHFTMTVDDVTVEAVYRAFMEPRYSYFAIWSHDHRTGQSGFVSVRRDHFVAFTWHLRNRCTETTYHSSVFWDVISQDLSLTNFVQTEPNNTRFIYCIRMQMYTMDRQDAHLSIDRRRPLVDVVDIPICHARALSDHTDSVMTVIDSFFPCPPEIPLIRFYGLRSPGMDFYWDHYLTRESIIANEGPGITLIEEEPIPAAPTAPSTTHGTEPSTAPLAAPTAAPDANPDSDSAPVTAEGSAPTEPGYSPVPIVDPVGETVCEPPSVLASGRVATDEFEAAVTYPRAREAGEFDVVVTRPRARESPELLDIYGLLEDRTRAEQTVGRSSTASPHTDSQATTTTAPSPATVSPVSLAPGVASTQAPESPAPLPLAVTPPVSQPPAAENRSPATQAPLDLSSIRRVNQGPIHADEMWHERPTTQLACQYLVCRAYEARIVAMGEPPYDNDHAEDARVYLTAYSGGLLSRINATLDQAGYMLNRLTLVGLTALIEMRGVWSPREEALARLSPMGPQDPYREISERCLRAMFNYLLRTYLN